MKTWVMIMLIYDALYNTIKRLSLLISYPIETYPDEAKQNIINRLSNLRNEIDNFINQNRLMEVTNDR